MQYIQDEISDKIAHGRHGQTDREHVNTAAKQAPTSKNTACRPDTEVSEHGRGADGSPGGRGGHPGSLLGRPSALRKTLGGGGGSVVWKNGELQIACRPD